MKPYFITLLLVIWPLAIPGCGNVENDGLTPVLETSTKKSSLGIQSATSSEKPVQEISKTAHPTRLLAPLSKKAPEELAKLGRLLSEQSTDEVRQQFSKLSQRERNSVDGVVLLASILIAESNFDEAAKRLSNLNDSQKATVPQLLAIGLFLTQRVAHLDAAESFIRRAGKLSSEDPMVDYRLCQCLMAQGKYDEGYSVAEAAKSKFAEWQRGRKFPLAWILMESIELDIFRIDVLYNLGPRELTPPEFGASRPLSFRIWRTAPNDSPGLLVDIFDFEHGWIGGELSTCAFGKTSEMTHSTYEIIPVDAKYLEIRKRALKFVKNRFMSPKSEDRIKKDSDVNKTGRQKKDRPDPLPQAEMFSSDCKLLVTIDAWEFSLKDLGGNYDTIVRVWDVPTARQLVAVKGHNLGISCAAISPDGKMLATGSWDKSIKLWDVETGIERTTLKGHTDVISEIAFSPDGEMLASGCFDGVKLWDVTSGHEKHTFQRHNKGIASITFSPDGSTLAVGTAKGTVNLWNVETIRQNATFTGHTSVVSTVTFAPNGNLLASGADNSIAKLWDVVSGRELATLHCKVQIWSLAFSRDGKSIATGLSGGRVVLWNALTGKEQESFKAQPDAVHIVAFSPDKRVLLSAGLDGTMTQWEMNKGVGNMKILVPE